MDRKPTSEPRIPRMVLDDFRSGRVGRGLREDLRELYLFYFSEEERDRLRGKPPVSRFFRVAWSLLRALVLRLSPVRRAMLLASLFFLLFGSVDFSFAQTRLRVSMNPVAYFLVLVVLLLELKDKLLARDEIEAARQVQLALLPKEQPRLPGWSLWCFTRSANDVGGDLVDHVPMVGGSLGIALGDVAGKGLGAALLCAKLQASIRAVLPEYRTMVDLGGRLNKILQRDGIENRYATLFFAEIFPDSGRMRVLNAGHNAAIVLRRDGPARLHASAPPLGMFPDTAYREDALDLAAGDMVVAFSDGLTEAQNEDDEEFGEARLETLVSSLRGGASADVGARVVAEVERILGDRRPLDDLSLFVVARLPA